MKRTAAILSPILVLLSLSASAQNETSSTEPGVTFRIYEILQSPETIPTIAGEQTPNHDTLHTAIDFPNEAFSVAQTPYVTHVIGQLLVPEAGSYDFRLTSDDGSRLTLNDNLIFDHDGRHGATSVTAEDIELGAGAHELFIEHFDAGGAAMLKLEWKAAGSDAYEVLTAEHLRTEADITRVTSPGFKRVEGARRPGDMAPLIDVHPSWTLSTVRPEGYEPKVGAMTFLPDGRLVIGTFDPLQRDEVSLPDIESKEPDALYAIGNLEADDPESVTIERIATDIYEPLGLCVVDDDLYVAHRREVTRLRDTDNDGFYETHDTIGQGWEGWNYHQFSMGLVHKDGKLYTALSTAMAPPDWEGMLHNAGPNGPLRGCLIEIDIETGDTRAIAGGLRTPNGLGFAQDGSIIYLDNQGTWMPTSLLAELVPWRFYGHYNWTNFVPKLADRFPEGGAASALSDLPRAPAAVFMPQNEVSNSPTQPLLIESGPYKGQLLVGELTAGGVRRIMLERVGGELQGALFRFTQGLESGVNRMAWGPDGSLYLGGMGAGGNWNWRGTQFGLQRLTPNDTLVFEMKEVRATPTGFRIEFTKPVDLAWLNNPDNFTIRSWTYTPTVEYGGPKVDERAHTVSHATSNTDGTTVTLTIENLTPGRCYHIHTDPVSSSSDEIWSTEAWYTLQAIPREEPIQQATIDGKPFTPEALGVGVLPRAEAVTLLGKGVSPTMRFRERDFPERVYSQDDLIDSPEYMEVGEGSGDLVSTTSFGDARIHIEWLSPPGGVGQFAGNSGVYLQDRYEIQVLGTKAGDTPPANNEAGAIYGVKAADVNASAGPGQWQAYDIWFKAARFEGETKVAPARVTVYWNGQLIHNDVELPQGTGSAASMRETTAEGLDYQIGPLRLQDHASMAEGPVRYRNIWIAPLSEAEYSAKDWHDPFTQDGDTAWAPRGGRAEFELNDNVLTGTSTANSPNTFYTSERTYADFELVYEVNVHPELNSGVQIRSSVDGGYGNRSGRLRGYQSEVDPSPRSYSGGIYDEARRGWLHPLHAAPYARGAWKAGDWNEVRVLARGPVIRTWVNGVPSAQIFDAADPEGHIGFQVHEVGHREDPLRVRYRNVRLRELNPSERTIRTK